MMSIFKLFKDLIGPQQNSAYQKVDFHGDHFYDEVYV